MSPVAYLRLTAAVPLVAPLPLLALAWTLQLLGVSGQWIDNLASVAFSGAFLFGGWYVVVVGVVLLVLRRASWRAHALAAAALPPVFAGTLPAFFLLTGASWCEALGSLALFAGKTIKLGYLYVAVVFALMWLLFRLRVLRMAQSPRH